MKHVVMCSLWKEDIDRQLQARMEHLTAKTYPGLRWIWSVGVGAHAGDDQTWNAIKRFADGHPDLDITRVPSREAGMEGEALRLERLSVAMNAALDQVTDDDDVVLVHESDLVSPADVVERLLAHGKDCVGAWTVLRLQGRDVFYDTWATRKNGTRFQNKYPYHPQLKDGEENGLYPVDSVGSVWIFPAREVIQHLRYGQMETLSICQRLVALGYQFWIDPKLIVRQPEDLWIPHSQ